MWWRKDCVDVVLLAEMNKFWPAVPREARWNERMRHVTASGFHSVIAFNKHQRRRSSWSTAQYGGVLATALNNTSHAVQMSGADSLGCFAWIRFRGRACRTHSSASDEDHSSALTSQDFLVVVSAYRPNPPSAGKETVWFQQMAHFCRTDHSDDPCKAFVVDLLELVDEWVDKGCEVVVGMDANDNLSCAHSGSFWSQLLQSGHHEVILSHHQANFQSTYQRNSNNIPIDGLFATAGVPVLVVGYYPFDEYAPSDHQALWVDIDWHRLLGKHRPSSRSFVPRWLTLNNQRVVDQYIKLAEAGYRCYNVAGRLAELMSTIHTSFGLVTSDQKRLYNRIHADAYTARRLAEKKCRKLRMGGKVWSPKGQELWDRISLWRTLLKGKRRCRVSSRKVRCLLKKTGELIAWTFSVSELEGRLHQDLCRHRALYCTSTPSTWRRQHITATTEAARHAQHRSKCRSSKLAQLRTMKQREETRRRRKARQKGFSGGLRAIEVDIPGWTQRTTITERLLVEDGCTQEITARYQQTFTPYPTPRCKSPSTPCSLAHRLSRTLKLSCKCRYPPSFKPDPLQLTFENHVEFWRKNPENRGSEPHGLHNGHFKAGVQSDMLASCNAAFREIPLSMGFQPEHWLHLMNFAIKKKPGDFRVSKIRTIQMMNLEFQVNNKLIGSTSMAFAERHQLIPPGQCRARKHHQAIDLAVLKRLIWDSLLLDREAAGCGQGNGAGPAIWVAISAILIDMMDVAGSGYSSRTNLSDDEIFAACFSFIDDTDVIETKGIAVSGEELLPSVRQALELWAGGVRATGGAINPEKSYWWLIEFDWLPSGKWAFCRVSQMPGSLSLTAS